MALAALAGQNALSWGEDKVYMRKFAGHDYSYANPSTSQNSNSDTISNPSKPLHNCRRSPALAGFVKFSLDCYTRFELHELKTRLMSELRQVRALKNRLETINCDNLLTCPPSQLSTTGYNLGANLSFNTKSHSRPIKSTKRKHVVAGYRTGNPMSEETNPRRVFSDPAMEKILSNMLARCSQILSKIMKHKFGWVFNKPVDVEGMKLFDYYQIVRNPMDLGTIKLNLERAFYKSPIEFAADVKLTFDNAMLYNPKEHDVHIMAKQLLTKFNDMFLPACKKFQNEQGRVLQQIGNLVQPVREVVCQEQAQQCLDNKVVQLGNENKAGKLPKPKAKDPNKRDMNFNEKAKLAMELEGLPQEKMTQLFHILKRKKGLFQEDGNAIELDIEAMDVETLWELDRFVSNYKKMINKMRRQEIANSQNPGPQVTQVPSAEMVDADQKACGEEDVDIGEEAPVGNYPPVEIAKDVRTSGSCSSSTGSSGSSSPRDSDSGSSSAADSDTESVQSPFVEANKMIM